MSWGRIAMAGAAVVSSALSSSSAKKASKKAKKGSDAQIEFAREAMETARADTRHTRQAGATALNALMALTGLQGDANTTAVGPDGYPLENPGGPALPAGEPPIDNTLYNVNEVRPENVYRGGMYTRQSQPATIDGRTGYVEPDIEGRFFGGLIGSALGGGGGKKKKRFRNRIAELESQLAEYQTQDKPLPPTDIDTTQGQDYQFQTDPGYRFRFEEGQRALDRGAAARGGLLSGGYGRKAIRYGQGFASNEYTNVYNRIANIAGLGQTANQGAANAAMYGGQMMGQGAAASGINSAYGAIGQANAYADGLEQLGAIDWGGIFNGASGASTTGTARG